MQLIACCIERKEDVRCQEGFSACLYNYSLRLLTTNSVPQWSSDTPTLCLLSRQRAHPSDDEYSFFFPNAFAIWARGLKLRSDNEMPNIPDRIGFTHEVKIGRGRAATRAHAHVSRVLIYPSLRNVPRDETPPNTTKPSPNMSLSRRLGPLSLVFNFVA